MSAGPALWQGAMYLVLALWGVFLFTEPYPSKKATRWSIFVIVFIGIGLMAVIIKWGPK